MIDSELETKTKKCTKCKLDKTLSEFDKKYREEHKEELAKKSADYYLANKHAIDLRHKQYALDHKEELDEYFSNYRKENADKINAGISQWKKDNPEKVRSYSARRRHIKEVDMDELDRLLSSEYRKAIANDPCFYCGEKKEEMHDDHFFPLAKGGTDHWWNLVRSCSECNLSKFTKCGTKFLLLVGVQNGSQ